MKSGSRAICSYGFAKGCVVGLEVIQRCLQVSDPHLIEYLMLELDLCYTVHT